MTKPFDYTVEILAGGLGWVDITDDVRGSVSITRGRSGEGYRADPGRCAFRLDNRTGRYSPRNPASDLYGYIGRNTPVRVHAGPAGGTLVSRFYGEIPSWPPRWSLSGADRYVDLEAAGLLRRFGQGDQPALSPMRRTIEGTQPAAYWPGEDGVVSSQAGSATSGLSPLRVTGTVEFRDVEDYSYNTLTTKYGTAALADLAGGGNMSAILGSSVAAATSTAWTVHTLAKVDVTTTSADLVLMEWTTGGTRTRWQLVLTTAGNTQVIAYTSAGASTVVVNRAGVVTSFTQWAVTAEQVGGNINVTYWLTSALPITGSVAGTLGGVTSLAVNPTSTTSSIAMPVGHLAVFADTEVPYETSAYLDTYGALVNDALRSWTNEGAIDRLIRLAGEAGLTVDTDLADDQHLSRMGNQPTATLPALLDEAIAVDGGMLFEDRDQLALAYQTRSNLYNQTAVTIAYAGQTSPPFDPTDDVDDVRNDVTVSRTDGSSARSVQATGPLAALEPPDGVGIYLTSETLNVDTDAALPDQAGWRRHLGTVDEPRYPAITVQLAAPGWIAAPALRTQLLALDVGGVLEVSSPPAWVSGRVRTLVTGYTETIDEFLWSITFNGVPASPWDVAQESGTQRVAADGATLAAPIGAGVSVLNGNPYFETNTSGWTAAGGTIARSTAQFHEGAASLLLTPSGVATDVEATFSDYVSVTAGQAVRFSTWLRSAVARNVDVFVVWSNGTTETGSSSTTTALAATTWTLVDSTATAPVGTVRARLAVAMRSTPPASHTLHVDEATIGDAPVLSLATTSGHLFTTNASAFPLDLLVGGAEQVTVSAITGTSSPQTATVSARSVNGVVRAWTAGTSVDVYAPAVVPL